MGSIFTYFPRLPHSTPTLTLHIKQGSELAFLSGPQGLISNRLADIRGLTWLSYGS